ncbi:hypothetical protein C060_01539 [Brucella melitensis UK22/04]|nr:hypothetical protein C060_01539 [Brucella melitensis UK22/04]
MICPILKQTVMRANARLGEAGARMRAACRPKAVSAMKGHTQKRTADKSPEWRRHHDTCRHARRFQNSGERESGK